MKDLQKDKFRGSLLVLSKMIYEEKFDVEVAQEFLDAIENGYDDKCDEVNNLKVEVREKESEISNYIDALNEFKMYCEVDFGIGKLAYQSDGNIVIDELMGVIADKAGEIGIQNLINLLNKKQ